MTTQTDEVKVLEGLGGEGDRFEVAPDEFLIYRDHQGYTAVVINGVPTKGRCIDDSYDGGREEFEMPQGSDPSMFFGPYE